MPNKNLIDLTGQRFGRLEVLKYNGNSRWECKCDCGKIVYPKGGNLRKGDISSCGCLRKDVAYNNHITHGETKSRLYRIWKLMRRRCNNINDVSYPLYGGRGISVCEEWSQYEPFKLWALSNGYSEELSIDRIDPNGNYEPSNCRWATAKEQANNKRNNHKLCFNGETHTISEWSEITGLKRTTIIERINAGWSEKKTLTCTVKSSKISGAKTKR